LYNALLTNPDNIVLLTHEKGMQIGETTAKIYKRQEHHDPSDLNRARELAEMSDRVPMGILYRNEEIGRYNEISRSGILPTWERRAEVLESAFDRFGIQASAAE
jgi:2-oxoglutarate ferredoxin oxidoreductase subunit beta